jgi:hypothetical protein
MKIEKNIPIAKTGKGNKTEFAYLVEKMDVGDCVFLDGVTSRSDKRFNRVVMQMKRLGFQPVTKKMLGGYRLWRTK